MGAAGMAGCSNAGRLMCVFRLRVMRVRAVGLRGMRCNRSRQSGSRLDRAVSLPRETITHTTAHGNNMRAMRSSGWCVVRSRCLSTRGRECTAAPSRRPPALIEPCLGHLRRLGLPVDHVRDDPAGVLHQRNRELEALRKGEECRDIRGFTRASRTELAGTHSSEPEPARVKSPHLGEPPYSPETKLPCGPARQPRAPRSYGPRSERRVR